MSNASLCSVFSSNESQIRCLNRQQDARKVSRQNLGRVLEGKRTLLSGAAIKSTISDNRTGNSQARFLAALDKNRGKSLLDFRNVGSLPYPDPIPTWHSHSALASIADVEL
ncbi:proteasome-activating nucleotidase [Trichoderma cornu-damae]|uniref:Proteasome-activating nucleotidase n=1 Tax=Trichoderma cornu-damae TaxID=654480 RepID=A0A9P8TX20_9HYPO|nr:proteasome-activating nucleotidase [Trichoderma cornu-damae]